MSAISTILTRLRAAIWAIDVRDDIANAIEQCYSDVSNPTLRTEALEAALQTKIDEGEMAALTIGDHTITAAKLAQGVIDNTLATSGAAADAKKTGDELSALKADLSTLPVLTDDIKSRLITCFEHVAWADEHGAEYVEALRQSLYGTIIRLDVSVKSNVIPLTGTTIEDTKNYLTVVAVFSTGTSEEVTEYEIDGNTLVHGNNTLIIRYEGIEKTVNVVAYSGRYATLADIASSIGYGDLSCTNGNYDATSFQKFSVLQFNSSIKRISFNVYNKGQGANASNVWYAVKKTGNDYICLTAETGVNIFALNQAGTAYSASVAEIDSIVKTGNGIKDTSKKQFILDNGTLIITGDNGGLEVALADCIGIWAQPGTQLLPVNVTVYE